MRVVARGSVIVRGSVITRGRLANVSTGGMRIGVLEGPARCAPGEAVEIELHLDRSGATWLQFRGDVVRSDEHDLAIEFTAVPIDFTDIIRDALASELAGATFRHVLLVDANAERRVPFAALLRRAGCRVGEAATPLEAIAHLGGSAVHRWAVAIIDTVPARAAEELERFLIENDPPVEVRVLGSRSPGSTLAWFAATVRASAG